MDGTPSRIAKRLIFRWEICLANCPIKKAANLHAERCLAAFRYECTGCLSDFLMPMEDIKTKKSYTEQLSLHLISIP